MRKRKFRPPKVDFDFTDLDLTGFGGVSILARTARDFGLFELLGEAVSVKVRDRGASDAETLWAIMASLARGDGALSDLDALRSDRVARTLLGLERVPEARRAGEWLSRLGPGEVKGLWEAAVRFAERVAPPVVSHEVATRGWDYSIGVTNDRWCRPVLDRLEGLPDAAWTDIGLEEEAILATHRPVGWDAEQHYVVVRRRTRDRQGLLIPQHTVILVSRADLPLGELVLRHRGKQGRENAFKGPLRDLDLHHPPCRSYRANQAFYALGQIAQVLLRAVQYTALPKSARRHGLRPVIRFVMRTSAYLVRTARRYRVRFAKTNFRLELLYEAMVRLEARGPPLTA